MKKRKTYEISVIDKTYSKIISDETKFYTSDTALELGFELKETEYTFESAEIVLFNVDDRSLITRSVAKVLDGFAYELEDDIIAHYGEWRGQLRFEQAGEIYVSSPVKFRIENDLSNDRPPQLSDVQSWVSLKRYADGLVDELKQAVLEVEGMGDTFNANELERQTAFEMAERERTETFNNNDATRQENEATRQQAESQRQLTFETNEIERQSTFETAEQSRQRAELIRIENENQRILTSIDEFVKLQDSIGGRNMIRNSNFDNGNYWVAVNHDFKVEGGIYKMIATGEAPTTSRLSTNVLVPKSGIYTVSVRAKSTSGLAFKTFINATVINPTYINTENKWTVFSSQVMVPNDDAMVTLRLYLENATKGQITEIDWMKFEKGTQATPYTKAPEDYTVVSKDDYYNHIKMMSDHRDKQIAELKTAITALGGA